MKCTMFGNLKDVTKITNHSFGNENLSYKVSPLGGYGVAK